MNRRPLHYISKEKEHELIQRLLFLVDNSKFDPTTTAILMASPDYSATVAMHLAHAWSRDGEIIPIIPIDVPYPDESKDEYVKKFHHDFSWYIRNGSPLYKRLVVVEAGVIRGSNWEWLLEELQGIGYKRKDITLVAMIENIESKVESDYVAEYFNNEEQELVFYFERFNNHWSVW